MDTLLTILTLGIVRFFIVHQGNVRLVMKFGQYLSTAKPGMSACLSLWGMYQKPTEEIPTKEQMLAWPNETVFTSDGVQCNIQVVLWCTITDPVKAKFAIDDYEIAVKNAVRSILRNECGKRPMRALLSGREEIQSNLKTVLERDAAPWGMDIRLVEMTNINILNT